MAVTTEQPAPYTAGNAMLTVISRYRDKGLATPITGEVLVRAGVTETLVPRTMQALQTLELIDETGQPTPTFQKIRSVPSAEYKTTLAEWIRTVYADVFNFVDPATDDVVRIRDAFRAYLPHGQQDRMVTLFLALCIEAGLAPEGKKNESKQTVRKPSRPVIAATSRKASAQQQPARGGRGTTGHNEVTTVQGLPPALTGLLQSIPLEKGWTDETRAKFLTTFTAVLDFVVPVISADSVVSAVEDDGEEAP